MRKVTNFFFTNKILQRIKQQFPIVVLFRKTKLWQSFSCTHPCLMTLSKLLRCCTCNVCASRQYIYTEGNNGNINESLEPCNNHTFNSLFSDPFSNSEADEFRKYSFCKENHRYKLSFKLSKSTEQKIDRMCKYTEHLDRQDLCQISSIYISTACSQANKKDQYLKVDISVTIN